MCSQELKVQVIYFSKYHNILIIEHKCLFWQSNYNLKKSWSCVHENSYVSDDTKDIVFLSSIFFGHSLDKFKWMRDFLILLILLQALFVTISTIATIFKTILFKSINLQILSLWRLNFIFMKITLIIFMYLLSYMC